VDDVRVGILCAQPVSNGLREMHQHVLGRG
jgi:hypothetical protein